MARNPFEQLQDLVSDARQSFEDLAAEILLATATDSRRIKVHVGDGGWMFASAGTEGPAN